MQLTPTAHVFVGIPHVMGFSMPMSACRIMMFPDIPTLSCDGGASVCAMFVRTQRMYGWNMVPYERVQKYCGRSYSALSCFACSVFLL